MRVPEPMGLVCPGLQEEPEEIWPHLEECAAGMKMDTKRRIAADWEEEITSLMEEYNEVLAQKLRDVPRIEALEKEIMLLNERCTALERLKPVLVPIESLAPEPYEIIKTFHAVVQVQDDQYIATFFDANISASGDTQTGAVLNLKDIIIGAFEILDSMNESQLGPGPAQQRKVLKEFVQKKG